MKNPELNILHRDWDILLVLAEVGSLSRSADRLGIQQPTLSTTLKKIEMQLGFKLFIRSKAGLKITPPGLAIVNSLREVKFFADKTLNNFAGLNPLGENLQGRMRLGLHTVLADSFLAPLMGEINAQYPGLDWDFQFMRSPEVSRCVLNYECDLGIVVNPTPFADLIIRNFGTDSVSLWNHEKYSKHISPATVPLLFNPEMIGANKLLSRLNYKRIWVVPDYLEICRLLDQMPSLGLLPTVLAKTRSNYQMTGPKIMTVKVALIYRRERFETPLLKSFVRDLYAKLQKLSRYE